MTREHTKNSPLLVIYTVYVAKGHKCILQEFSLKNILVMLIFLVFVFFKVSVRVPVEDPNEVNTPEAYMVCNSQVK